MQINAQIQLEPDDIREAIRAYVRQQTGREILSEIKCDRERGIGGFNVSATFDVGPDERDQKKTQGA
ncbi:MULTISPECIES: hypothetical protein [Ralstonia]|jgi:hypothetical protein|nr:MULTISPECIES: hypothetical protein [Ralstonia]MBL4778434.1 hypothetical protein [Ralstonia sp.]MCM3582123.1 hypothetical protein [Ralstonia pickettii]